MIGFIFLSPYMCTIEFMHRSCLLTANMLSMISGQLLENVRNVRVSWQLFGRPISGFFWVNIKMSFHWLTRMSTYIVKRCPLLQGYSMVQWNVMGVYIQTVSLHVNNNTDLPPSTSNIGNLNRCLTILFISFCLLSPRDSKIIWLSNLLTVKVPDEGYSRNPLQALNQISTLLFQ